MKIHISLMKRRCIECVSTNPPMHRKKHYISKVVWYYSNTRCTASKIAIPKIHQ